MRATATRCSLFAVPSIMARWIKYSYVINGVYGMRKVYRMRPLRTLKGAQQCGRIRGYLPTVRTQAQHVFEAIRDALAGQPCIPSPDRQRSETA